MSETRLQQLEERVAWLQRHVVEQDKVMMELGDELGRTQALVATLRTRLAESGEATPPTLAEERPPHY